MPPRKKAAAASSAGVFDGLTFCVSGTFSVGQNGMKEIVIKNGGHIAATPNKTCTYLVADSIGSSKTMKAKKDGISIVTEQWVQTSVSSGKLCTDKSLILFQASAPVAPADDDEEMDDADDDDDKKSKSKKGKKAASTKKTAAKKTTGKRKKAQDDDDEEDEEEEEDDSKSSKKSGNKRQKKSASSGRGKKAAAAADDDDDDDDDDASVAASSPPPTMKTVIVKGKAPVDEKCSIAGKVHVYEDGKDVYDAMLNQTNIGNNNNKFYIIQLLESDASPRQYWVWTRWGRVGVDGQNALQPMPSVQAARAFFCSKFTDKTKNMWDNRANFRSVAGKYTLLERDYSSKDDDAEDDASAAASDDKDKKVPESKLDPRVQDLIKLICDLKMMEAAMKEVGYDANRLPLGKLSKDHVKKGYEVLQQIANVVNTNNPSRSKLVQLSNEFYSLIPHVVGMRPPPVLDSAKLVKEKIAMVESLADIEVATKLLKQSAKADMTVNPVDAHYEQLKCDMKPLEKDGEEFKMVETYTQNTHGHTHNRYKLEVLDVLAMDRQGEADRFTKAGFDKTHNRQLLWHGSRLTNFVGIISQGLRIAPPEAPVTGYMFGKGVYFADMVSKSANYCATSRGSDVACMLLCEVALGDMNELKQANYYASQLPAGKLSTKGLGAHYPDPKEAITLKDGTIVPLGHEVTDNTIGSSLLYNEFIVYDVAQIRVKYLVKMKFNYL